MVYSTLVGALESFADYYGWCVDQGIYYLGSPKEELNAKWVKYLCCFNGVVHCFSAYVLFRDKHRFLTLQGEKKVAVLAVMNDKYVGTKYAVLSVHILSGMISHFGSALAIGLESIWPQQSNSLAHISSAAELYLHAPTALYFTPSVYGDKGVAPLLYGLVSSLLVLSGASSLRESQRENIGKCEPSPELRRMNATISIFLYVRLYPLMRGINGILSAQKYALAILMAGSALLPIGWTRAVFPATFWGMMAWNYKTILMTRSLIFRYGIDGAAKHQADMLQL